MKSLYFDVSIPKILVTKIFSRLVPSVCFSPLSPVSFGELPDADLPGPSWVRVKNRMAGICGTDLSLFFVKADPSISIAALPGVPRVFMGHEVVGTITETGSDAKKFSVGDRVIMRTYLPCCDTFEIEPPCDPCRQGNYCLCENFSEKELPPNTGAGFGDQFVAHQSQLVSVPEALTDDEAVLVEPAAVSLHAVLKHPPQSGEPVLVIGAGTIGLNVIQCARAMTPDCRIFVMERIDFKKELALKLGADEIISGDLYQGVADATSARLYNGPLGNRNMLGGFPLIYDCVGQSRTIHDALRWLKAQGVYIMVGNQLAPIRFDQTPVWHQELTIIGVNSHGMEFHNGQAVGSFDLAMQMIRDRQIRLDGFVTHRFPLQEYRQAFRLLRDSSAQVIKAVFEI